MGVLYWYACLLGLVVLLRTHPVVFHVHRCERGQRVENADNSAMLHHIVVRLLIAVLLAGCILGHARRCFEYFAFDGLAVVVRAGAVVFIITRAHTGNVARQADDRLRQLHSGRIPVFRAFVSQPRAELGT